MSRLFSEQLQSLKLWDHSLSLRHKRNVGAEYLTCLELGDTCPWHTGGLGKEFCDVHVSKMTATTTYCMPASIGRCFYLSCRRDVGVAASDTCLHQVGKPLYFIGKHLDDLSHRHSLAQHVLCLSKDVNRSRLRCICQNANHATCKRSKNHQLGVHQTSCAHTGAT